MTYFRSLLLVLTVIAPAVSQDWFGAPQLFFGNDPVRVVMNVDADADLDLVRVLPLGPVTAGSFTVMVNPGNADFVAAAPVAFPVGVGLAVAGGDVTGDGNPDLVFATDQTYAAGTGFLVHPGSPSGAFGAPIHKSISGSAIQALHLADVNGDTILDVGAYLVNPTQAQFNWHPALGGGAFATWPGVTIPTGQLSPTRASLILDTDGDGIVDVALAGAAGLIFCPTLGSATVLGATLTIATAAGQDAFAAGDVDADGDVDVIYSGGTPNPPLPTFNTNIVRILNLGGGFWSGPVQQTFPGQQYWPGARLSIGYWDGDGLPDVVMTTPKPFPTGGTPAQIRFFAGTPSGSLALGFGILAWESDTAGVGIFEVSGDGVPDFVGGSEIVFGVGGFASPFGQLATGLATFSPRDWDDDGDLDFESVSGVGSYGANDGSGTFAPVQLTLPPPPPGMVIGPQGLQGDFNGDQRPDWVVAVAIPPTPPSFPFGLFSHHRIYSDAGNGTLVDLGMPWSTPLSFLLGNRKSPVGDVNGDGFDDVIAQTNVWYSNGAGLLAPGTPSYSGNIPVAAADADGDSDLDFMGSNWAFPTATVTMFVNAGGGVFNSVAIDTGSSALADGRLADLDDDGDIDVLLGYGTVTVNTGSVVHVIENLNNTSAILHQLTFPTLSPLLVLATVDAGDVDRDGQTDLVLGYAPPFLGPPSVTAFSVLRRTGPGVAFEAPRTFSTPSFHRLADLDDDGDLDATGPCFLFNRRFPSITAGSSRQFGMGAPGTAGIVPILGRKGPVRPGSFTSLRVRRGLGGALGVIAIGTGQSNVTYPGLPGVVSYAEPWLFTQPISLGGVGGQAGAGWLDLGATIPPSLSLTPLYFQVGIVDTGAPATVSVTNGLEILFGL